jgi:hypothetical protein
MKKLILLTPLLLLVAVVPARSQGAQFPNAANATEPPSINSPPLTSLDSPARRPARLRQHRQPRRHRPASARQQSFLGSAALPQPA